MAVVISSRFPYRFQMSKNVAALLSPARNATLQIFDANMVEYSVSKDSDGADPYSQPIDLDEDGEAFFYIDAGEYYFVVQLDEATNETIHEIILDGDVTVNVTGTFLQSVSADVSLNGAQGTATDLIPEDCTVWVVLVENQTDLIGSASLTGYNVGLGTDKNAWSRSPVGLNLGDSTNSGDMEVNPVHIGGKSRTVIISAYPEGETFSSGTVKVTVRYVPAQTL